MAMGFDMESDLDFAEDDYYEEATPELFEEDSEAGLGFEFRPLSEDEVKSIIQNEIMDAHGAIMAGTEISQARRDSLRMFFGKPLGNEIEGRSQVVLTEVADTIHWIMPSLMRMFASGEDIFEFQAQNQDDEQGAIQATKFINKVFWDEMDGFSLLYDWFFTTLLERNGFITAYWDERVEPKVETYSGLTESQVEMLMNDGRDLEPVEFNERESKIDGQPVKLFDLTVRQTARVGRIKVRGIPPEEFLIARRIDYLTDEVPFVGERVKMTVSDLIAMGFDPDMVKDLPTDDSQEFSQERLERRWDEETFPLGAADRQDTASREIWVNNVYIRIDEDGDGYSELRNIMVVGDTSSTLIHDEYANFPPYATLSASPVPFKFFGQSIPDLVGDLQVIRTTMMRQMLDNLYLLNNQRTKVVSGQVELNDLTTSRPGGIVRMDSLDSMEPIVQPPLPSMAMDMMRYLDEIREVRVGVSRYTQGLDGGSLNGTATGVNAMMGASQSRVELIGRIFAHTGIKRLGKMLLRLYKQHDNKKRSIRLNGTWIDIDPSLWNEDMDVNIKTGLGIGAASEQMQHLMATIQLQKEALLSGASFMVQPKDLYRAVTELNKAMGFRGADVFFSDPGDTPWPEEKPDTKVLENQRRVVDDQAKNSIAALEAQSKAQAAEALQKFRDDELAQNASLERERLAMQKTVALIQNQARNEEGEEDGSDGGEEN
jgi:hypothetical protein